MKSVSETLSDYLNQTHQFLSCDLYALTLTSGVSYFWNGTDKDITLDGKVYSCRGPIIKRNQTQINNQVTVDTMTVTIYADSDDKINGKAIKLAAHDGDLDRATFSISRCFFDDDGIIGAVPLFTGLVEISKCGGLALQVTVKAKTSGLAQEFPRRRYYPQGAYTTVGTRVSSTNENTVSCLIAPYVPLKEVLL